MSEREPAGWLAPAAKARILTDDERGITFRFRRSDDGSWQTLTLRPAEFLRRFLQHVLPRGFQRVRSYGWLAPAAKAKWQRIEALLDWQRPAPPPVQSPPAPTLVGGVTTPPCCRRGLNGDSAES